MTIDNDWPVCVLGRRADYDRSRRLLSLSKMSALQIFTFLCDATEMSRGILLVRPHWSRKPRVIRVPSSPKLVYLEKLIDSGSIYPFSDPIPSELLFVPWLGRRKPSARNLRELFDWACKHGLPWVSLWDNENATFSNFPSHLEKQLFMRFLRNAVVKLGDQDMTLRRQSWSTIRRGIYDHGWTLNPRACSWFRGVAKFHLWGGTLRASVIKPVARLSEVNRRLTIQLGRGGMCDTKIVTGRCPYDDITGC
jgi:hypothetical protein